MRIDSLHTENDRELINSAYEAHQRVTQVILLFQDRLDKVKDAILNDQEKSFSDIQLQLRELESISRQIIEITQNNKTTIEKIEVLSSKIINLEAAIKNSDKSEDLMKSIKELKPILDSLTGKQERKEQSMQKAIYAFLGISMFLNVLALLVQLGVIPMPWVR